MYAIDWVQILTRTPAKSPPPTESANASSAVPGDQPARRWLPAVHPTVWALGFTSLFTDISSEMVASILPLYLVLQIGLTPLAFGFVDGLYQGVAALVRVASGVLGDRWRRHKELAVTGYALSALCRIGILAAGSTWTSLAGVVAVDRIGKGIRTAPRDALIASRTATGRLATAFGVHRGLDAAGAMLGPVVAFVVLASMPGAFDVLFVISFAIAVVGVGIIGLFVPTARTGGEPASVATERGRIGMLSASSSFRAIVIAAFLLGVPTMSDSFVYLTLQGRAQLPATAFPLYYVLTSLFTSMLAIPFGRAADRFGRARVLLGGYALLAAVYGILLLPAGPAVALVAPLVLLGAYYAATDGVLTAMAAAVLRPSESGSGLAVLATAINIARFAASVLFGLLWMRLGVHAATLAYLAGLVVAIVAAAALLTRVESNGPVRAATVDAK